VNRIQLTKEEAKEWVENNLENFKVISVSYPNKEIVEIEYCCKEPQEIDNF